ncbi:N-acetylmuramoyl-L-alanine amidase [Bauldia sp.]|uniref:N-acetylmuramoyl-L-alanine amidase n=1 Tax=Bauldia sp. TaxID=2575872 RepID=UPI003BAA09F7
MAYSLRDHFLHDDDDPVQFIETPNQSSGITPTYLIMHYTAGTSLSGATSWFANPEARASAHLTIDKDGKVVQMVRFNRKAWHAGRSAWAGLSSLNAHSIGIELVNAGKLRRRGDGKWVNWANNAIPNNRVAEATHKDETSSAGWELFPDKQVETAIEIAIALRDRYNFVDVLGHDDVSPGRKVDPGPLFPMISFKSRVLGRE